MSQPKNTEQYVVQTFVSGNWVDERSYEPDLRSSAITKAKSISRAKPSIPVRVVYDSFNHLKDYHTRAVIYTNGLSEHKALRRMNQPMMQVNRYEKERVGLLEYVVILFSVIAVGAIAGILITIFSDLVIKALDIYLANGLRTNILAGIFLVGFLLSATMAYQYVSAKYVYDPNMKLSRKRLKSGREIKQERREAYEKEIITEHMKSAAEAISKMPVESHQDQNALRSQKVLSTIDEEAESLKPHPLAPKEDEQKAAPVAPEVRAVPEVSEKRVLMTSFVANLMAHLKKNQWPLDHRTRYGLSIVAMGAMEKISEKYQIYDEAYDQIVQEMLKALGMKNAALDRFVLACETYMDHKVHRQLMVNGAFMIEAIDEGADDSVERISGVLHKWLKEEYLTDGFQEFTLSIECLEHLGEESDEEIDEAMHDRLALYFMKALSPVYPLFMEQSGAAFVFTLLGDVDAVLLRLSRLQEKWVLDGNELAEFYDPPQMGMACEVVELERSKPFIPKDFDEKPKKKETVPSPQEGEAPEEEELATHTQATFLSLKAQSSEIFVTGAVKGIASDVFLERMRKQPSMQMFEGEAQYDVYEVLWREYSEQLEISTSEPA